MNGKAKLNPVRSDSLRQRAYLELREALLCGRFMPGEAITVRQLTEDMQVGVMPVRECVRQLAAEGALEIMPNRSVRVPALKPEEFDDVFEARKLIEGNAAARAAKNASKEQIGRIASYLQQLGELQEGTDAHECLRANMHFHFEIYRAAGSPQLVEIIERLWLRVSSLLVVSYAAPAAQRKKFFSGFTTHKQLLKAIEAHDVRAAEKLTKEILTSSHDWHVEFNPALRSEREPLRRGA
jgi:DNA-binding GntR family transcriptional regulator